MRSILASVAALLFIASLGACDVGAACQEACSQDSDCAGGLMCSDDGSGGQCVPSECSTCFESSQTCYYSNDAADGSAATCSMDYCQ